MNPKKNAQIAIIVVALISLISGILAIVQDRSGLWIIVGAGIFTCLLIGIFITSKGDENEE